MNILLNQTVVIALRLVHITSGVLWVGSGILFILFLLPAVKATGPVGGAVMQKLGPSFGKYMGIVTTLTVVSGALLYSRFFVAVGFQWIWTTGSGIGFTVGAIAGLTSYVIGERIFGPTQAKINALGVEMAAAGQPSAEQVAKMDRLQSFLMSAYRIDVVILAVAVGAMAVARYL